jgi:cytoskeletal protein CcmA (bactofilin family)
MQETQGLQGRLGGWLRRTPGSEGSEDGAATASAAPSDPARETGLEAPPEPAPSRIEHGWEIEGNLRLDGPLLVLGDFTGAIDCGDVVTVAEGASVQGPITARRVVIHGGVVGDVHAARDVELSATAKLHGDVDTPSLVIARGAFFRGHSKMASPLPRTRGQVAPVAAPLPVPSATA